MGLQMTFRLKLRALLLFLFYIFSNVEVSNARQSDRLFFVFFLLQTSLLFLLLALLFIEQG